jgi:hypothetical protein
VVEAVVEAVVLPHAVVVASHLGLALLRHVGVLNVLLEAPDDPGVAVVDVLAEGLHLPGAGLRAVGDA